MDGSYGRKENTNLARLRCPINCCVIEAVYLKTYSNGIPIPSSSLPPHSAPRAVARYMCNVIFAVTWQIKTPRIISSKRAPQSFGVLALHRHGREPRAESTASPTTSRTSSHPATPSPLPSTPLGSEPLSTIETDRALLSTRPWPPSFSTSISSSSSGASLSSHGRAPSRSVGLAPWAARLSRLSCRSFLLRTPCRANSAATTAAASQPSQPSCPSYRSSLQPEHWTWRWKRSRAAGHVPLLPVWPYIRWRHAWQRLLNALEPSRPGHLSLPLEICRPVNYTEVIR